MDRDDRRRVIRVASAGAAAGFVVALLVVGGLRVAGPSSSTEAPTADPTCLGAMTVPAAGPECAVVPATSAAGLRPSLDDLESDTAGGYSCWRPQGGELTTCHYGSTADDALRLALVGDSHAAMLLPALHPILEERNWSLDTYVGYGCQWVASPSSSDCSAVMEQIQQTLLATPTPYDAVLTTAARWAAPEDTSAAVEGYVDAWAPVAEAGSQIVVVADSPGVSDDALECLARLGTDPSECGTSWQSATVDPDPLIEASASVPGAVLVDMSDFYCEADWCPAAIGNVIVYRDTAGHVTGTYMKTLSPYLADRLSDAFDGAR